MISSDGMSTSAVVELKEASDSELRDAYSELREEVRSDSLDVLATGDLALGKDFDNSTGSDLGRLRRSRCP
jgi:hypothetical protein